LIERGEALSMLKLLVWIAVLGIIFFVVVAVIAPSTPDGSWLHEFGEEVSEALQSFFGNPVTVE
jgi:hypothetical protein